VLVEEAGTAIGLLEELRYRVPGKSNRYSADIAGAAHARRTGSRSRERSYAVVSSVIRVTQRTSGEWIYKTGADGLSRKPAARMTDDATRRTVVSKRRRS
jgi:hypothetical protein